MEITIINQTKDEQWLSYQNDFETIAKRCVNVIHYKHKACVSVIFVDTKQIHEINQTYRNIDRPTDVISFALQDSEDGYEWMEEEVELGDIFISVDAICEQAKAYGHSIRRECCFLFTHGLLHLCGYDHMSEEEEQEMFHLQDVILDEIVPKTM